MIHIGTYNELMSSSASFSHLLEDIHQQEQELSVQVHNQLSVISSTYSEQNEDDDLLARTDTKQKGAIKLSVYLSYVRAGLGYLLGFVAILILLTARQATYMYSAWWLAKWSDDEGHRYGNLSYCPSAITTNVTNLYLMSDNQWNEYRNTKFFVFCGKLVS